MREAAVPLEYLPPNVSAVGPIVLSLAPVAEQDAELEAWLARAPTVLVNLATVFKYHEERAHLMAKAIKNALERTNVQILWKMDKLGEYGDEFKDELQGYVEQGRLRIVKWLTVDPAALVESGHIVASVHHGGSNCYHEALRYTHFFTPPHTRTILTQEKRRYPAGDPPRVVRPVRLRHLRRVLRHRRLGMPRDLARMVCRLPDGRVHAGPGRGGGRGADEGGGGEAWGDGEGEAREGGGGEADC